MRATKIFIGGPVYTGGNGWRPAEDRKSVG